MRTSSRGSSGGRRGPCRVSARRRRLLSRPSVSNLVGEKEIPFPRGDKRTERPAVKLPPFIPSLYRSMELNARSERSGEFRERRKTSTYGRSRRPCVLEYRVLLFKIEECAGRNAYPQRLGPQVVRITGIALGWMAPTSTLGSVVRDAYPRHSLDLAVRYPVIQFTLR